MKKYLLICLVLVSLLAGGCGPQSLDQMISDRYSLIDTRPSKLYPDDIAYVFQADKDISAVASEIANLEKPQRMISSGKGRVMMSYPQGLVHLYPDKNNLNVSFIELMSMEYAANNYTPGYFEDEWEDDDIFDDLFKTKKYKYGTAKALSSGWASIRSSSVRGGGPALGK